MLGAQIKANTSPQVLLTSHKPCISGENRNAFSTLLHKPAVLRRTSLSFRARHNPSQISATATSLSTNTIDTLTKVEVSLTVQITLSGFFSNLLRWTRGLDDITDLLGKSFLVELVATELGSKTGLEKPPIKGYARRVRQDDVNVIYETSFVIPEGFGEIGAVLIENEKRKEVYIKTIQLDGFPNGPINVTCDSWVHSKFDNPEKRIFFTNKSFLPSETPSGLKKLREKELATLRGDGDGELKPHDRVYDYDVYNDIGDPDANDELKRPVLGTKLHPYPRRGRTGRPRTKKDPFSEERSNRFYVPRDEAFSEVKGLTFSAKTVYSVLRAVIPSLETTILDPDLGFPYFTAIDSLYNEGVNLEMNIPKTLGNLVPRLVKAIGDTRKDVLLFETPEIVDRDKFCWMRDEEFCRQTIAGLNPCCIRLVEEWPLRSKLDPEVYGPAESTISKEKVEEEIGGIMSLEQALKEKRIFLLDYHDVLLPYVHKVRELKGTTLYGSRTLMFLTHEGTLRPLAIELTRPKADNQPEWRQVFTPSFDATGAWLWKLAKAHVLAHDSGYHQLVSHWLRTHCCTEPYIIATNRQLSAMHPIYRLLHPHFRYTMEINALARLALINAGGIIESSFFPGKYAIELSSAAYDLIWRFDREALPEDLISRGMAVEDKSAPHGVRLVFEDYPYANDGLVLWDTIKQWVSDYVNIYYTESSQIKSDKELQSWWTEIRTVGHGDKKDEPWWPKLENQDDLIGIITTIIWVTSGHHAAVNFGQYDYAGYVPNRPTMARVNMPCEDPTEEEWKRFIRRPEDALLSTFPSQIQATKVMAILDVLSNHSPDEEYLGEGIEPSWEEHPQVKSAYEIYCGRLKELEGIIDGRNADSSLLNRTGAGVVPYQLLKPFSEPGVTGMGVPNSISI